MDIIQQIYRSNINDNLQNLKFGQLAISDVDNTVKFFAGRADESVIELYNSSSTSSEYLYENIYKKFVSTGGDDLNNGQSNKPFLTIMKGLNSIQAGGVVRVDAGAYNEELLLNSNLYSQKTLVGDYVSSNGIVNNTILYNRITLTGTVKQFTLSNFKFEVGGLSSLITISSAEGNFNFNSISISNNVQAENIINVFSGGIGYISLDGCDFNNKSINLSNTETLRYCYITNCKNLQINAGNNWIVLVDRVSVIEELSDNNNIIRDDMVNDIVNVEPSTNGIYIADSILTVSNGKIINKGDVFTKENTVYRIIEKFYNAKLAYYVINKQTIYGKNNGEYKPITIYPIDLKTF